MSPEAVGRSSLWQLASAIEGYNHVHGGEEELLPPPTPEEYHDMVKRLVH